jgi:hypothetical protein
MRGVTILNGTLPAAWSNLTALQVLELQGNADTVYGAMPASWGALKLLTTLQISNMSVTSGEHWARWLQPYRKR